MNRKPKELPSELFTPPFRRLVVSLENPCASLCTNNSRTRIAVVGRKVFKILKISPDHFEVVADLRDLHSKQINLNYSNNDVHWNPKDDSQLATAPTNGSVILWDINKQTKNKLAHAFEGYHQRAVNKLSFHPREPNILISGSQDSSMNVFDTRQKTVVATYKGPDSVRDVQFPTLAAHDNNFASCYDNGVLQIWDRRRTDHSVKHIPCHNGPVYCCAWHPDQENWIMSAGRDKMIKGFDIQQGRPKELFTIPALFSVARARWRPAHKNHVASCSHFLDNSVQIWDTRRPYIPFASFTEHSDDVTDFLWLTDNVLVSCSKDGKVIQQLFPNSHRPVERATPVGLSFHPDGSLAHACSESLAHKCKTAQHSNVQYGSSQRSYQPMTFRKADTDPYQQSFLLFSSSLREHNIKASTEKDDFIKCATSFKLHGLPVHELCDHNYRVANEVGKKDIAQTWLILKLLYCGSDPDCSQLGLIQTKLPPRQTAGSRLSSVGQTPQVTIDSTSDVYSTSHRRDSLTVPASDTRNVGQKDIASENIAQNDIEEEADDNNPPDLDAALDFFELDDDDDSESQNLMAQQTQQEWKLPAEPIQLRHDIVLRPPSPDHEASSAVSTTHSAVDSSSSLRHHHSSDVLTHSKANVMMMKPQWNFSEVVKQMLQFYADKGDVQMSVSAILVLGDMINGLLDIKIVEQWFSSYIDLLIRHHLWTVAAQVIKLCPLEDIRNKSQESTTYNIGCGNCNKYMDPKGGWQCKKCEKITSICSVCHSTVRGLYVWCQVCGHGGHLKHVQEWHRENPQCPAGCGHECSPSKTQQPM